MVRSIKTPVWTDPGGEVSRLDSPPTSNPVGRLRYNEIHVTGTYSQCEGSREALCAGAARCYPLTFRSPLRIAYESGSPSGSIGRNLPSADCYKFDKRGRALILQENFP